MSVTKSYKTITFSNTECFAVVRALTDRAEKIKAALAALREECCSDTKYLDAQLVATEAALAQFRNTAFLVGPWMELAA